MPGAPHSVLTTSCGLVGVHAGSLALRASGHPRGQLTVLLFAEESDRLLVVRAVSMYISPV